MFETRDVLVDGVIAGVLAGGFALLYPWARTGFRFGIAAVATFLGFVAWNLVISHAKATGLNVDAPVVALSWQDAGSGVLAFAASTLALGLTQRSARADAVILTAGLSGVVAMVFDIFVL